MPSFLFATPGHGVGFCTIDFSCVARPPPPPFSLHLYMVYASHPFPFFSFIALDQVPSARQLSHVHELHNQPSLNDDPRTAVSAQPSTHQPITFQPADKTSLSLYVGGGLPPVPAKLAQRIQDGQFVEMVELLPEVLRGPIPYDTTSRKVQSQSIGNLMALLIGYSVSVYTSLLFATLSLNGSLIS